MEYNNFSKIVNVLICVDIALIIPLVHCSRPIYAVF